MTSTNNLRVKFKVIIRRIIILILFPSDRKQYRSFYYFSFNVSATLASISGNIKGAPAVALNGKKTIRIETQGLHRLFPKPNLGANWINIILDSERRLIQALLPKIQIDEFLNLASLLIGRYKYPFTLRQTRLYQCRKNSALRLIQSSDQ